MDLSGVSFNVGTVLIGGVLVVTALCAIWCIRKVMEIIIHDEVYDIDKNDPDYLRYGKDWAHYSKSNQIRAFGRNNY